MMLSLNDFVLLVILYSFDFIQSNVTLDMSSDNEYGVVSDSLNVKTCHLIIFNTFICQYLDFFLAVIE